MKSINLNDKIKVKLTPLGADIYYHRRDELYNDTNLPERTRQLFAGKLPAVDKDGYTTFSLWYFMQLYGSKIGVGFANVIDPIEIIIDEVD